MMKDFKLQISNSKSREPSLYELENITYSYMGRFRALNSVSLSVAGGEKVVLLGANGSGKSTLLLVMAGLIFPTEGVARFMGETLTEDCLASGGFRNIFRRRVGIVFQNSDAQLFNSTVRDEILFGLVHAGIPADESAARLEKYSKMLEIGHLVDRHPQYLSMGEKKRVALASVLAMEPEVLLLDEPTAGLDPRTTRHLIDTISAPGQAGRTVITATQDIHAVSEIADRAVVLGEDKAVAMDKSVDVVLQDRAFLERHNLLHAHAHRHDGRTHVHPHEHPDHHHPHA